MARLPWLLIMWWIHCYCPRTVAWISSPGSRPGGTTLGPQPGTTAFRCRTITTTKKPTKSSPLSSSLEATDDDDVDPTTTTTTTAAISRRMEQIQQSSSSSSSILLDAAAAVTQQSCELLGIKSVGVDYGLVRTGLAATVGYDPKPLGILSGLNNTEVCDEVITFCQSEQANQIVVGLPLHKNGTEAEQTNLTKIFANELSIQVLRKLGPNVPVYMWDERYTSKFAAARAHSLNPNQELYGTLDADAACIILEHYYEKNGKGARNTVDLLEPKIREECLQEYKVVRQQEEEANRIAQEQRIGGKSTQRQQAMERAKKLEEELAKQGTLGVSRKKKKKKKKMKKKREPRTWLVPGQEN